MKTITYSVSKPCNIDMKSNQELVEEAVGGELEVSKQLDTFQLSSEQAIENYFCMDCKKGNTKTGEERICEGCAYM